MSSVQSPERASAPAWRGTLAGPLIALFALAGALAATAAAGVPLRDPGDVTVGRFMTAAGLAVALAVLDVAVRAARRDGRPPPSLATLRGVARERWTGRRALAISAAIVSFYVTYFAYRNVKSVVPLLAPGTRYDRQLGDVDRSLFAGHDPADLLHSLLGTGVSAHVLSAVYLLFFAFVPLALTVALVCSKRLESGLFFATALALNWVLAAVSYRLLPSLGPVYADPGTFAGLPHTGVTTMQESLIEHRTEFLSDPDAAGAAQSIGAFASLHFSLYFTAAVAAHLLGYPRAVRAAIWAGLALTATATVYFGWHYVLDDVGAILIGVLSLVLARVLTGLEPRKARAPLAIPSTSAS
jgi:hypothetical protein